MASVELDGVKKVYENGFEALHGLDLRIADGEFMILVGPSGCGKTTALRMVAGLEGISAGEVRIGGAVVNDVPPRDRDIAMVFQNYALYPHMTVAQNIAFALKVAKVPKADIERRVREVAEVLGLSDWLGRRPGQLSGGQRQRVAMGRAIIRQPSVFLMDEPLSNLDAKLRVQMRAEVSRIQHDIGVSTIYVTHDQVEAMTMGDRVAVLNNGSLQQCASPQDLYDHPDNLFVAAFIGSPSMNLYGATLDESASTVRIGSQTLRIADETHGDLPRLRSYRGGRIVVGIRPEHLSLASDEVDGSVLRAEVQLVEALGSEQLVHFTIDTPVVIPGGASVEEEEGLTASGASVARLQARSKVKAGDRVKLVPDMREVRYFDPDSELAIR